MKKYYVEVGSTVTKVDSYDGHKITREKEATIFFKKNYAFENKLKQEDIDKLIEVVLSLNSKHIKVYGTSIFRKLTDEQKEEFLNYFKEKTGLDFDVVSADDEGFLTVKGAIKNVKGNTCVFIGGGGSTEIALCHDSEIINIYKTDMGVMDGLKEFSDLALDYAQTSLDKVVEYAQNNLCMPSEKVDTIILAGGGHEKFARESGIRYQDNTLFSDTDAPIMMGIKEREEDTGKYYTKTSLDAIKAKSSDPAWWDATRVMAAFVLALARHTHAKYIVPTDIAMVHGMILEDK